MNTGKISATPATGEQPLALWQVALIALAVLLVISELGNLALAFVAKTVIDGGATAHDGPLAALSNAFFMYSDSGSGQPVFTAKGFLLLPGFNTLYYLTFGLVDPQFMVPFITSGIAALLVCVLAILGYLTMSAGRGTALKLLLALFFAVSWVILYTAAESSMFGGSFWSSIAEHSVEFPATFVSLLVVSRVASRRG